MKYTVTVVKTGEVMYNGTSKMKAHRLAMFIMNSGFSARIESKPTKPRVESPAL